MPLSSLAALATLRRLLPAEAGGAVNGETCPCNHRNGRSTASKGEPANRIANVLDDLFGMKAAPRRELSLCPVGGDD
jgi:hypothetical protein